MMTKKGLTLTELLVSTVLIGIVMVGVASFSMTIKNLQESSNQSGITMLQMISAMRYITRDASFAVGEEGDRGVWVDDVGVSRGICFRHDTASATPGDYTDDTWVCYVHDNTNVILRCEGLAAPVNTCPGSTIEILTLNQSDFFEVVDDADGRLDYIEIILNAGTHNITTYVNPLSHGR